MIYITEEKNCCGCGACAAICPVNCITMVPGTLGSVFPQADADKCVKCGKCNEVCPIQHAEEVKQTAPQTVYAAYSKDDKLRAGGSSGGMFGTIATELISRGYRIYAAGFDENKHLRCMYADSVEELVPLMKSKYLQSDILSEYSNIKNDLKDGRQILFVSTPCQVAALKRYLGKNYENLVTIDFLCHGVPSQILFDKCVRYEEEKGKFKILSYSFRTKIKDGSTPHYFTMTVQKNGKEKRITKPYFRSIYYAFFQKYISLRESCYDCVFSEKERVSDITIADFHEIEKYVPSINRFDGVSTVIINTQIGESLLNCVKEQLWMQQFSMGQLEEDKVLFAEKTKKPAGRKKFIEDYNNLDFPDFVNQNMNKKKYLIFAVYYKLPKALRRIVKKFILRDNGN